ncbi:MAG: DUF167 family protein [Phenylobacterium sp.]|uniref:DUF167 family protein n=1 Tax=Phenylobacterium sp. TaxID=1871053 RepID=UPI0027325A76|nr:DUF167 family protein [Phenylobacterium sp.]MDP3747538.1 DUF167 family protein [Phenylobacterium sp.]
MRLPVRVTPKGGRDAVDGWARDPAGRAYLKVRVSAAAADGEANAALTAFLAKTLKVSKSSVRIVSGETARLKMLQIEGLDEAALEAAFGAQPQG